MATDAGLDVDPLYYLMDNAMVTSVADLGELQTKPNNAYLPLHDIPFWKHQTKDIEMVTSAADLGDLQTKPNQIMHI